MQKISTQKALPAISGARHEQSSRFVGLAFGAVRKARQGHVAHEGATKIHKENQSG